MTCSDTTLAMLFDEILEPVAVPRPRRATGERRAAVVGSAPDQMGLAWGREVPLGPVRRGGAAGSAGTGPRARPPGPRRPAPRPGAAAPPGNRADAVQAAVRPGPVAPEGVATAPAGSSAPVRRPAPVPVAAAGLLRQAAEGLAEAVEVSDPLRRYPAAYLSALRAGAAVLAVRAAPQVKRGASRNVWALLADVAPELGEWAAFFASCSRTRAAAEAGTLAVMVGADKEAYSSVKPLIETFASDITHCCLLYTSPSPRDS